MYALEFSTPNVLTVLRCCCSGPSWAQPRSELPDWAAQHQLYVEEMRNASSSGQVSPSADRCGLATASCHIQMFDSRAATQCC